MPYVVLGIWILICWYLLRLLKKGVETRIKELPHPIVEDDEVYSIHIDPMSPN